MPEPPEYERQAALLRRIGALLYGDPRRTGPVSVEEVYGGVSDDVISVDAALKKLDRAENNFTRSERRESRPAWTWEVALWQRRDRGSGSWARLHCQATGPGGCPYHRKKFQRRRIGRNRVDTSLPVEIRCDRGTRTQRKDVAEDCVR